MHKSHAQLLTALSIILLVFVAIDIFKISNREEAKRTEQKTNLVEKADEIGQVLSGYANDFIFLVKDSSNNSSISDATVAANTGGCYVYTKPSYYHIGCDSAGPISITVSRSGYTSKTTNINKYVYGNPDVVVTLVPATSNSNSNSSTPSSTTQNKTTSTTKAVDNSAAISSGSIKDVVLPSEFSTEKTTKLSSIPDLTKVEDFTLDTSYGTIKFESPVDLSGSDVVGKFISLNEYVYLSQIGVVQLDSAILPFLNKPATITMKDLTFVKTPRVLVDGKEDKSVVSNVKYKDKILTFDVKHFTTFTAAPTVGINEPANNFEVNSKTMKLKGTVSDPSASVSAKLNNKDLGKLKISTTGAFEKEIDLEEGENNIVVSAIADNLATASASVSGILKSSNLAGIFALLGFLTVIAIGGLIYAIRYLRKRAGKAGSNVVSPASP